MAWRVAASLVLSLDSIEAGVSGFGFRVQHVIRDFDVGFSISRGRASHNIGAKGAAGVYLIVKSLRKGDATANKGCGMLWLPS